MNNQIVQAVEVLKKGGIAIFPTDTAYGIGCRIDNPEAVERLFRIRKRPVTQAVPVLVSSPEMAMGYFTDLSVYAERLMNRYWPGALTVVGKCRPGAVPDLVCGGGKTIGVRMPNHPVVLDLIRGTGVPVLGPSANFHGEKTPFSFADLDPELTKIVDVVVGGNCMVGNVSTVVDTTNDPPVIIRQGAVVPDWS